MIVVFCEFGGKILLSKAREIADSSGDRVWAVVAKGSNDPQELIYLGADQVSVCNVNGLNDWIGIIADFVIENDPKCVIFPSDILSNMIMGAVYSSARDHISSYLDEANLLDETKTGKSLEALRVSLQKKSNSEKCRLVSLRLSSLPQPFEDSTRYGRINSLELKPYPFTPEIFSPQSSHGLSSSSELTVLIGAKHSDKTIELCNKLAQKFHGKAKRISGSTEIVYGPCVAVEVDKKLGDLPVFNGEIIAIGTRKYPINHVADVEVVTHDLSEILEGLLR